MNRKTLAYFTIGAAIPVAIIFALMKSDKTTDKTNQVSSAQEPIKSTQLIAPNEKNQQEVQVKKDEPEFADKSYDRNKRDPEYKHLLERFTPERRVIEHPEFGLVVQLVYPKGDIRYEFPGPNDTEVTHDYEANPI